MNNFQNCLILLCGAVLVVNGESDDIRLKAPWIASIFYKNENKNWELICSGTITSPNTVITSARCMSPRVQRGNISTRPFHYGYHNLQVVAGMKTNNFDAKDEYTQYARVGQVRDYSSFADNSDSPYQDLSALRLRNKFNFSTPYVKSVRLLEQVKTIAEANATKPQNTVLVAGIERIDPNSVDIQTRSKTSQSTLKVFEIILADTSLCIDQYTSSYTDAFYFDVLCGQAKNYLKEIIPCRLEGAGMITKARWNPKAKEEEFYLMAVYSSNTALAKNEGNVKSKMDIKLGNCAEKDLIFFTQLGYLGRWGISHDFCDNELAMCQNNRCRPWEDLCSGLAECEDASDENPKMCHNYKGCSSTQFRCKYGACIDKSKTCNGVIDCSVDSSDEDSQGLCKSKGLKNIVTGCPAITQNNNFTVLCTHPDRKDQFQCSTFPVPIGTNVVIKKNEVRATCTQAGVWSDNVEIKC